ncbi:MAG: hypothetical protein ACUVYA_19830, partial [Planctomycetota bacterium]
QEYKETADVPRRQEVHDLYESRAACNPPWLSDVAGREPDPETACDQSERVGRILDAIAGLPPLQGYLVLEVLLSGTRLAEAARRASIRAETASGLLWRAKLRLRAVLRLPN